MLIANEIITSKWKNDTSATNRQEAEVLSLWQ
jgi:hypothetical protein